MSDGLKVVFSPPHLSVRSGTPVVRETVVTDDYDVLRNHPQINGVELVGDRSWDDLGLPDDRFLPEGGSVGDLVTKTSNGYGWVTPATAVEADNTRPITSAAVYTEVGNINALLATI